jgi:mono/diheme cytochrome c family protein
MNFEVLRNGSKVNQLNHFQNEGLLNPINPGSFAHLPNSTDLSETVEKRARAYLDMNCAHCHNQNGFASDSNIDFGYELSQDETGIAEKKTGIMNILSNGDMPKLGTTLLDEEGLALIKNYIENIK